MQLLSSSCVTSLLASLSLTWLLFPHHFQSCCCVEFGVLLRPSAGFLVVPFAVALLLFAPSAQASHPSTLQNLSLRQLPLFSRIEEVPYFTNTDMTVTIDPGGWSAVERGGGYMLKCLAPSPMSLQTVTFNPESLPHTSPSPAPSWRSRSSW